MYAYDDITETCSPGSMLQRACTYLYDALVLPYLVQTYTTTTTLIVITGAYRSASTPTPAHLHRKYRNSKSSNKPGISSITSALPASSGQRPTATIHTYDASTVTYEDSPAPTNRTTASTTAIYTTATTYTRNSPALSTPTTHSPDYYYGYRYYNPELGRWVNKDPIGELGAVNIYSFNFNDAIDLIDPIGLLPTMLTGIGKDLLKRLVVDVAKETLGAMFEKWLAKGRINQHMRTHCPVQDEWHPIDVDIAELDGLSKQVAKRVLKSLPGKLVDAVLWNKLKSAKYIKHTRGYARIHYGSGGQKLTEKILGDIASDIRKQTTEFAKNATQEMSDYKGESHIKYTKENKCTICYTLETSVSFNFFGERHSFSRKDEECLKYSELKKHIALHCGLCPCGE